MSQRLLDTTKWLFYILALHNGYLWTPAGSVTVRTPPSNPATIQAQAKFFQYRHLPTSEDFDQGHRLGSDRHFTERHERSRPSDGLFSAKVRWGDKKGGYGEHYWDLNHAGHAGNHGSDDGYDDDGSYHEDNSHNPYQEHSDQSPNYGAEDYDSDKSSQYDESGRAKRAHPRLRTERRPMKSEETKQKSREVLETAATHNAEYSDEDEADNHRKVKTRRQQYRNEENNEEYRKPEKERNQVVLVVTKKDDAEKRSEFVSQNQPDVNHYVPYEGGAGVRQHQQPEASAANTVPRLFLEPSTGHVVDRATGQAYVLQPITIKNYN